MDDHGIDDLVDQDLSLCVVGGFPDGVGVHRAQQGGDLLELLGEHVALVHLFQNRGGFGLDGLDLAGELGLFVGERGRGDLVRVVQVEQLLALRPQRGDGPRARRLRR